MSGGNEDTGNSGGGKGGGGKGGDSGGMGSSEYGSGWGTDSGVGGGGYSAGDNFISPDQYAAGERYDVGSTGGGDPFPSIGGGGGGYDVGSTGGGDPFGGGGGDPGNLGGSGPVGGIPGLPDAGGGTNTWGNIPGRSGQEFDYFNTGAPITAGGVSSIGADTGAGSAPVSLDEFFNSGSTGTTTASSPAGPGASALAAPSGVSGIGDLTVSPADNDIFDAGGRDRNAGGTNQTRAATDDNGLLRSLGIGGNNTAGALTAGAALLNNLVSGRRDTVSSDALRGLAVQNAQNSADIRARSQSNEAVGRETAAAGQRQIGRGEQMTTESQALQQWVRTGTLPAAYETQIAQGVQSAITRLKSVHAAAGRPTDPGRNSTLAEEIRQVEARAPEMRMQMAQSLANTGNQIASAGNQTVSAGGNLVNTGTQTADSLIDEGLRSTGLSADIYRALLTDRNARNQRQGNSIASFASALNSSPRRAA